MPSYRRWSRMRALRQWSDCSNCSGGAWSRLSVRRSPTWCPRDFGRRMRQRLPSSSLPTRPGRATRRSGDHAPRRRLRSALRHRPFLAHTKSAQRLSMAVLWEVTDRVDFDRYQRVSDELVRFCRCIRHDRRHRSVLSPLSPPVWTSNWRRHGGGMPDGMPPLRPCLVPRR